MRPARQVRPSSLIHFGIVIASAHPKHKLIDNDFNSTRKSPIILNGQFPSAGMRIDDSDEQPLNAKSPINENREPDSNVMVDREEQYWK
jgi:hypothetical protein